MNRVVKIRPDVILNTDMQTDMLQSLDLLRDDIVSGRVRALLTVTIRTDGGVLSSYHGSKLQLLGGLSMLQQELVFA